MTKAVYEKITRFCNDLAHLHIHLKDGEVKTYHKDIVVHEEYLSIDIENGKLYVPYESISYVRILAKAKIVL